MFTGIISDIGEISSSKKGKDGLRITVKQPAAWRTLKPGDSVAVNGVCLTAESVTGRQFEAFLMPETLKKTSFGQSLPKKVNLERPLRAGDELGGHFVQGHIDCVGQIKRISRQNGYYLYISYPEKFSDYLAEKGSIAVDGVSLTIVSQKTGEFSVALIPFTLKNTTLGGLKAGDSVNLEFDMISKQVAKIMKARKTKA